jgi:3-oxoadipate enol-lactonase
MTPWTTLVTGNPRIAVASAGRGPLVLFLHGIGGNRHSWTRQVAFFSDGFTAAAWDARGYGDSEDYEGPLDFSALTSDLLRVLDHFKAEKANLVGLSMGGRIARNFALAHPERLSSLVLANTSPGFDTLSPEQVRKFVEERRNRTPESMRRMLGSKADKGAFDVLLKAFHALRKESFVKTLEASVAQDRAAPIEKIRVPTLVITGDEDPVYPPALQRRMAERIPGARFVEFQGCGHLSNLEQPELFNDEVLRFLKALSR